VFPGGPGDCASGVFIAEEIDELGNRSGDTTTVNAETLLEAFLNMSLRSACFFARTSGLGGDC
jgi:hypothetical protein